MIELLNGKIKLYQSDTGFKSTSDAVFLAATCLAKKNESVLDLGCGVGTVGLCLKHRVPDIMLTGLDIQADHIEIAQKNATENNIKADFICADINDKRGELYHHVVCNPPFLQTHAGSPAASKAKATAKHHANLQDWIKSAHRYLKAQGTLTLLHRADHIHAIIAEMHGKFGRIELIPLWPKEGKNAKRIIIRALKDSKSPTILTSGLVLHNNDGSFTAKADAILKGESDLL